MRRVTLWTIGLGIGIASIGASPALAEPRGNAKEAVRNEREIRVDKGQVMKNRADVRWLERELEKLDRAHAEHRGSDEDRIRKEVRAFLRQETAEVRRDLRKDQREAAHRAHEQEEERREAEHDARELERERAEGKDREQNDAREASAQRLESQMKILTELREIQPDVRRRVLYAVNRERVLFQQFLEIARKDARARGGTGSAR